MSTVETEAPQTPAYGLPETDSRPEPASFNPWARVLEDIRSERRARVPFPPGDTDFSFARTRQMAHDPLPILLSAYERYGPIFSLRLLHGKVVFMLGPEANAYVTVTHPHNFHWREGSFGDLIPLLGDGLLTIDGGYHDRARGIMMPAFHREQIEAAVDTMTSETAMALEAMRPGHAVDIYAWMRNLAMRIAMRALLGLDPDGAGHGQAAAEHFERALSFYGTDYHLRLMRGPRSPWRRMMDARKVLDRIVGEEIARRRATPDPNRTDVLSLLLVAHDEDGAGLSDEEIRDQLMTLMFAGHDTSTSTVSFLLYELARNPQALAAASGGAGRGPRRRAADACPARRRAPVPRHGRGRGAAPLSARLDRPTPRRARFRVRRQHRPGGRARQLRLLGQPPTARGLPRPRGVHPGALQPRAEDGAARAAPTCRSAAARGSASASASGRRR